MPRYTVQRIFQERLQIRTAHGAGDVCRTVIQPDGEEGIT